MKTTAPTILNGKDDPDESLDIENNSAVAKMDDYLKKHGRKKKKVSNFDDNSPYIQRQIRSVRRYSFGSVVNEYYGKRLAGRFYPENWVGHILAKTDEPVKKKKGSRAGGSRASGGSKPDAKPEDNKVTSEAEDDDDHVNPLDVTQSTIINLPKDIEEEEEPDEEPTLPDVKISTKKETESGYDSEGSKRYPLRKKGKKPVEEVKHKRQGNPYGTGAIPKVRKTGEILKCRQCLTRCRDLYFSDQEAFR